MTSSIIMALAVALDVALDVAVALAVAVAVTLTVTVAAAFPVALARPSVHPEVHGVVGKLADQRLCRHRRHRCAKVKRRAVEVCNDCFADGSRLHPSKPRTAAGALVGPQHPA